MGDTLERVRVDRWLLATRTFKTRGLAQAACVGGHVKVNGNTVKPSHLVALGDEVRALAPRGLRVLIVRGMAEKRLSAQLAAELFEDKSPPPPPRETTEPLAVRARGAGRPTKADRRAMARARLRRGYD